MTEDLFTRTSGVRLCTGKSHFDGRPFDAGDYFMEQLKNLSALAGVKDFRRNINSQEDRLIELFKPSSEH